MKRLKKVLIIFLVFGTSMLTTNCADEEIDKGQLVRENPEIAQAKEWFESTNQILQPVNRRKENLIRLLGILITTGKMLKSLS